MTHRLANPASSAAWAIFARRKPISAASAGRVILYRCNSMRMLCCPPQARSPGVHHSAHCRWRFLCPALFKANRPSSQLLGWPPAGTETAPFVAAERSLERKQVANGVRPVVVEQREVDKWGRGSSPSHERAIEDAHQPEVA